MVEHMFAVVLPMPLGVPSGPWGGGPDAVVPEELVTELLQALMRIAKHYVAAYKSGPTTASSDCVAAVVMASRA